MTSYKVNISDQTKCSKGSFPIAEADVIALSDGRRKVAYTFSETRSSNESITLEDLAGCLRASHDLSADEVCERIMQFARRSGPLFGAAEDEALSDWQLAIDAAQEALRMQQQVNGTRDWHHDTERIVKTRISDSDGTLLFVHYCFFFATSGKEEGAYSKTLPKTTWVKLFDSDGASDYLYAKYSEREEDYKGFDIHVIACPSRLSPELLVQTMCFLNDSQLTKEELVAIGVDKLVNSDIDELINAAAAYGRDGAVAFEELQLGKADAPHVQHIVQAIAALHLRRVTIDLFKADDTGDSLSFDTYLNSLWYDFATRLGAVKVGYCEECGAGFSLTGHRGLPKRYCSNECRTKAKNRREREKTERARTMYLEGRCVIEIAKELYPDRSERIASKSIVATLAKWPRLKQAIKAECAEPGEHPFAKRCCEDGLISERRLELLERHSTKKLAGKGK